MSHYSTSYICTDSKHARHVRGIKQLPAVAAANGTDVSNDASINA